MRSLWALNLWNCKISNGITKNPRESQKSLVRWGQNEQIKHQYRHHPIVASHVHHPIYQRSKVNPVTFNKKRFTQVTAVSDGAGGLKRGPYIVEGQQRVFIWLQQLIRILRWVGREKKVRSSANEYSVEVNWPWCGKRLPRLASSGCIWSVVPRKQSGWNPSNWRGTGLPQSALQVRGPSLK